MTIAVFGVVLLAAALHATWNAIVKGGADTFLRVWTDVVARGGRGETPYDVIARVVVERWVGWTEARLLPDARGQGHAVAIALLAMVDGLTLLEMASPGCTAGARKLLPSVWRCLS